MKNKTLCFLLIILSQLTTALAQNSAVVFADAGPDQTCNCYVPEAILGTDATTTGATITYQWTSDNGVNIDNPDSLYLTVTEGGNYFLQVTDTADGQMAFDTVTVIKDKNRPAVEVDPSARFDITCDNEFAFIDLFISDTGEEQYEYTWTNEAGDIITNELDLEINEIGEYTLETTNVTNGCVSSGTYFVEEDTTKPLVLIDIAIIEPGETIQLDATRSLSFGGLDDTYEWVTDNGTIDADANTLTPTISSAGDYCLTITNAINGCTSEACINASSEDNLSLFADAGPDRIFTCATPLVTIGTPYSSHGENITYSWIRDGIDTLSETSPILGVFIPGTYVLTVTYTPTQQTSTDTMFVDYQLLSDPPVRVSIDQPAVLNCTSDSILLSSSLSEATEDLAYIWRQGEGGPSISDEENVWVHEPGRYVLTVIVKSNGCSNTYRVEVSETNAMFIEAITQDVSCFGANDGAAELSISGGVPPYSYNPSSITDNPSNLTAGNYVVTVMDSLGCTGETSFVINEPSELITNIELLSGDTTLLANATGGIAPYLFNWNTGSTDSALTVAPNSDLTYSVTITDVNGCEAIEEITLENPNAIFNTYSAQIHVFPNPTSGLVTIEQANIYEETSTIQVFDILGKNTSFEYYYKGNDAIVLDLNANIKGIYFLHINLQGKPYIQKIVLH